MAEIVSNPSRFFISQPMDSGFLRNDGSKSIQLCKSYLV